MRQKRLHHAQWSAAAEVALTRRDVHSPGGYVDNTAREAVTQNGSGTVRSGGCCWSSGDKE
jgi:hypothetical protein